MLVALAAAALLAAGPPDAPRSSLVESPPRPRPRPLVEDPPPRRVVPLVEDSTVVSLTERLNRVRSSAGRGPLRPDEALCRRAAEHAALLASRRSIFHSDRATRPYAADEGVAYLFTDPIYALTTHGTPGRREDALRSDRDLCGWGWAYDDGPTRTIYWVVYYATSPARPARRPYR